MIDLAIFYIALQAVFCHAAMVQCLRVFFLYFYCLTDGMHLLDEWYNEDAWPPVGSLTKIKK